MRRPEGHRAAALPTLIPVAVGHIASVAIVCMALVYGVSLDRQWLQALAGGLLAVIVVVHLSGRTPRVLRALAGHTGWALGSFAVSTAHGAGLALVPALMPLCLGGAAAGQVMASGALSQAVGAVLVHAVVMLAFTGPIAIGVRCCRNGVRWIVVQGEAGTFPRCFAAFRRSPT